MAGKGRYILQEERGEEGGNAGHTWAKDDVWVGETRGKGG